MRSESRRRSLTDDPANIKAFRRLLPYLWEYRRRLVLALSFLHLCQACQCIGSPCPKTDRRWAESTRGFVARAGVPANRLWLAQILAHAIYRSQRCRLCARHAACNPARSARGISAFACVELALPPR